MQRNRGIALITTLIMSAVVVMLLSSLLISSHGTSLFSHDYHAKISAAYTAETGLSILQDRLLADPDYATTTVDERTPFGTGTFTIRFGADGCINNLSNDEPVAGPYGPIPAHSAFIRIEGNSLGHREVIECILGRPESDFITAAAVASGKIYLDGNIKITGRVTNDDDTPTSADVISNYQGSTWTGTAPLHYVRGSGEDAVIEGTVRSASSNPSAISPDLVAAATDALTDQTPVPLNNEDIIGAIRARAGNPAPPITTGAISGTYHTSSNHTIAGDLVLDNAELYIDGDLTVIGSIKGRGAVYVAGDTTFSGDSEVTGSEDGVVLYSDGNVSLRGFDGSQYMDAATSAAGGNIPEQWEHTRLTFQAVTEYLREPGTARFEVGTPVENELYKSDVGVALAYLANEIHQGVAPHPYFANLVPRVRAQENMLWTMQQFLQNQQPPGPARDFMLEKFRVLRSGPELSDSGGQNLTGALGITYRGVTAQETQKIIDFAENGTLSDGIFNKIIVVKTGKIEGTPNWYTGLTDQQLDTAIARMANWFEDFDYDKLGTSFFKGNIYTHGAIYAANEVTIIGSVSAVADPDNATSRPNFTPVSGVSLRPGDLYLANGTTISFVSELTPGIAEETTRVGVSHWLR